jgi:hypothetical protein
MMASVTSVGSISALPASSQSLGLLGVVSGTGAVFAGVIGEHLVAALIAAPQMAAEGLGAASQDVGDGTAMRGWHRRTMGRQIAVRKPAEDAIRGWSSTCRGGF